MMPDIDPLMEGTIEVGMESKSLPSDKLLDDDSDEVQELLSSSETYTLGEAIEHIGFGVFQIKLMLVAGLSWMGDGIEVMVLSIISPYLLCLWSLSSFQEAFITTIVFLGISSGAPFWGWIVDKFGRKKGLYGSGLWLVTFGLISSQSQNYTMILVFRGLVGFGVAGMSQAITMATEMIPTTSRANVAILCEICWAFGSLFTAAVAIPLMVSNQWRWYLVVISLPCLLFLLTALWMPESPRYLLTTGRHEEAKKVLEWMAKGSNKQLPNGTLQKIEINENRGKVTDLFNRDLRFTSILLLIIWFTGQFSYYGVVLLTTQIYQSGVDGCHPYEAVKANVTCRRLHEGDYIKFMWTSMAEIPGLLITMGLLYTMGRKHIIALLSGIALVSFSMLCVCMESLGRDAFLFIGRALSASFIQVTYAYTAEVFPTNVRGIGTGFCNSVARFGAILTPFVAQVLIHVSFYSVIAVYIVLLFVTVIAALLLPIETKGRILENSTSKRIFSMSKDYGTSGDYPEIR